MSSAQDDNLARWASYLVDAFVHAGVKHCVISPGSRSTPWVWAACNHSGLRCESAFDERSAGFYALGMAKASNRPTLLICT